MFVLVGVIALALWRENLGRQSARWACVWEMNQISKAGSQWAVDHGGVFPERLSDMSNGLLSVSLLHCPADPERPFTNWSDFTQDRCSYEILAHSVAAGDTNTAWLRCKLHGTVVYTNGRLATNSGARFP
jgi:hypothetical protein